MAKLIDKEPKYEGEIKAWNAFGLNLPQNWVIYNTRSVNGREYDFCIMAPEVGLFIVEVKGWYPTNILSMMLIHCHPSGNVFPSKGQTGKLFKKL